MLAKSFMSKNVVNPSRKGLRYLSFAVIFIFEKSSNHKRITPQGFGTVLDNYPAFFPIIHRSVLGSKKTPSNILKTHTLC